MGPFTAETPHRARWFASILVVVACTVALGWSHVARGHHRHPHHGWHHQHYMPIDPIGRC